MRILHLLSQHPESTGSGIYLQNIIAQAAAAGHTNFLIAGTSGDRLPVVPCIGGDSCRFVSFGGGDLDFIIPGMSDVMPYPSTRFADLDNDQLAAYERAFAGVITSAAKEFVPDIIHSHHLWLASSIAREVLPDVPMVTSCHSTDLRQSEQCPYLRRRVLPYCRGINRILALSREQTAKIINVYGIGSERLDVVGGGYDDQLFVAGGRRPAPPVNLLYAGKLSLAKGVDWLLRTFMGLRSPGLHLHLAGSGSGEETRLCMQLAAEAGAAVTVHGRVSQQELARLMGKCHIFILPSFYEGLPLVLLEALAAGCRIITTDLPCCRELLAEAGTDLVSLVRLPALPTIDRPDPGDWQMLQAALAGAISEMASRVQTMPSPVPDEIAKITLSYTWRAVFQRILASYERAIFS